MAIVSVYWDDSTLYYHIIVHLVQSSTIKCSSFHNNRISEFHAAAFLPHPVCVSQLSHSLCATCIACSTCHTVIGLLLTNRRSFFIFIFFYLFIIFVSDTATATVVPVVVVVLLTRRHVRNGRQNTCFHCSSGFLSFVGLYREGRLLNPLLNDAHCTCDTNLLTHKHTERHHRIAHNIEMQ